MLRLVFLLVPSLASFWGAVDGNVCLSRSSAIVVLTVAFIDSIMLKWQYLDESSEYTLRAVLVLHPVMLD